MHGIRKSKADRRTCLKLLEDLDTWYSDLPPHLNFDESNEDPSHTGHSRQLLTLQLRYQHAGLLVSRPFLLKILQTPSPDSPGRTSTAVVPNFGRIGVGAALKSSKLIRILWRQGLFEPNLWPDAVFAYQSGVVLSLACFDTAQKLTTIDHKVLEGAVENTLNILRDAPSTTTNQLVQITNDISSFVRAVSSDPIQPTIPDQQSPLQAPPHNRPTCDVLQSHPQMPFNPTNSVIEDNVEADSLWNPPSTLSGGVHSGADSYQQRQTMYPLDFQDNGMIDFMVDWDFPPAFGFDSGNLYHNC